MTEGFSGAALLGIAEPDGSVPFVVVGPEADGAAVVVAGLMVGGQGLREVEGNQVSVEAARAIVDNSLGQHGLAQVPVHVALYFGARALREGAAPAPPPWTALWESVPEGVRTTATLTSPLRRMDQDVVPAFLHRCSALVEPDGLLVFGLSQEQLGGVVPRVVDALQGQDDKTKRTAVIAAAVAEVARGALDTDARDRWSLALDVLSVLHAEGDAHRAARHTALAVRNQTPGDELPFVRIWVERALASTVELAIQLGGPRPLRERLASRGIVPGDA